MTTGNRTTWKLTAGMSKHNVCTFPYYMKPISNNPFLGSVHDGSTTEFRKGFSPKPIGFLQRFRHNLIPQGFVLGSANYYNPRGKFVHWLEVSTIKKFMTRVNDEECTYPRRLSYVTFAITAYAVFNMLHYHPDLTYYNIVLWTTKPFVQQMRFNSKHRIDEPVYRVIHRSPEFYFEDPQRDFYKLEITANDPWLVYCKAKGTEKELLVRKWGADGRLQLQQPQLLPIPKLPTDLGNKAHNPAVCK